MAARRKTGSEESSAEPSFEESLYHLESIIEAMEHENLPLEDLVSHYEKGSALLGRCEAILQSARGRIELITLRNQNEIALDAGAKNVEVMESPTLDEPDDVDDNDIRLF